MVRSSGDQSRGEYPPPCSWSTKRSLGGLPGSTAHRSRSRPLRRGGMYPERGPPFDQGPPPLRGFPPGGGGSFPGATPYPYVWEEAAPPPTLSNDMYGAA